MIEIYGFGNTANFNKTLSLKNRQTLNELESNLVDKLDNLSSFDPDSLTLLSYLHLTNVKFNWIQVSNPSSSPTGELPVLKSGLLFISGLDKIISWLKTEGYDLDKHLTSSEKLYNLSYFKLFGDYLKDSHQYYTLQDDTNFINWTRPLLGKLLHIPFNYITPGQLIDKSKARLNTYYEIHNAEHTSNTTTQKVSLALKYYRSSKKAESSLTVEFKILNKLQSTYEQIETKLGDKSYLFGEELTSTDLICANYILCQANPIWKNPVTYTQLTKNHQKLIDYALRVNEQIGKINLNQNTQPKSNSTGSWFNLQSIKTYLNNNLFLSKSPVNYIKNLDWESLSYVGLGLGSLVGYAIYHGFIQFEIVDENETVEIEQKREIEDEKDDERVGYAKGLDGPPKLPILRDDSEDEESSSDEDDD